MKTYQDDLGYVRAGLEEAQSYLLSDQLYGLLTGSPPSGGEYPALTVGGLLLALTRLRVWAATPAQQVEVQKLEPAVESLRRRWQVAWANKTAWEFRSRVKQWETYLNEIRQDSEKYAGYYRYGVRQRVMLDLLAPETHKLDAAYQELLQGLDVILESYLVPGDFIWEPELLPAFPQAQFWYLYGTPRTISI